MFLMGIIVGGIIAVTWMCLFFIANSDKYGE